MLRVALFISLSCLVTSCATVYPNTDSMSDQVRKKTDEAVNKAVTHTEKEDFGLAKIKKSAALKFSRTNTLDDDKGTFMISSSGSVKDVINIAAKRSGYENVVFVSDADIDKEVSISLKNVSPEYAIKKIAQSAGLVAILDKKAHSVTISKDAVYTFKLPSSVFNQLNQTMASTFNSGSNGGGGGASIPGVGGGGGGNNSSGGFAVNGFSGAAQGNIGGGQQETGVTKFIESLAGKNADVSVNEDIGMVVVRSNAVSLERVRKALNKFANVSSRRVAVEATFIEVSLGDVFEYGIDWDRVLSDKTFGITGGGNEGLSTNASGYFQYSFEGITSIVSALKTYTNVSVMSQPKIETGNRVPTTFFDGLSVPYLGEVQAIQQQTSSSTAGTISYADDGVRLSFIPDIISDEQVEFLLLPLLSSVGAERSFELGGGTALTDFVRARKEALLSVNLKDGQTAIIGGLRSTKESGEQSGIPGFAKRLAFGSTDSSESREVVLLLHAKVIPGQERDTLFSESL